MWRVYYEDGTTWNWTQGFEGIPTCGVICILQNVDTGIKFDYHIVFGCKYYMHAQDEWLHAYENDVVDYIQNNIPIKQLLIGRMTTNKIFREVYSEAQKDKNAENL